MMPLGKYIATYQQSHRLSHAVPCKIFYDVEEREQSSCFEKQSSHKLKLRTMKPFSHHCTSCCCHGNYNISFFITQIKGCGTIIRQLKRHPFRDCLLDCLKMTCIYSNIYWTTPMYLPLAPWEPKSEKSSPK